MRSLFRHAVSSLLFVAAGNTAAGVITQDGVVFTSTFTGKVLTLEIDAANRSGGWAGASAIDALAIKTIGSFSSVKMTSSTGAAWALSSAELNASGCAGKGMGGDTRLCYSGGAVGLADNMLFTFTFEGAPVLNAPHLKVHFVDASGIKVGSLLSKDFPSQGETAPAPAPEDTLTPGAGMQQGDGASQDKPQATTPVDQGLIPPPVVPTPAADPAETGDTPANIGDNEQSGDVPEPQSLAIAALGLAVMGLARRRRRPA